MIKVFLEILITRVFLDNKNENLDGSPGCSKSGL